MSSALFTVAVSVSAFSLGVAPSPWAWLSEGLAACTPERDIVLWFLLSGHDERLSS